MLGVQVVSSESGGRRVRCVVIGGGVDGGPDPRVGRRGECPGCHRWLTVANMARHARMYRRVWNPGWEPGP